MTDSNTASFKQAYPIDLDLYDQDQQPNIYISDALGSQTTVEITNTATENLQLKALKNLVSKDNFHFALNFRPGTLATNKQIELKTASPGDWELSSLTTDPTSGIQSLYIKNSTENFAFNANQAIRLVFSNMLADNNGGSRGSQVELIAKNLRYVSAEINATETFNKTTHIQIVNHNGEKRIPLHVAFSGGNAVLNDGSSKSSLLLRINNTGEQDVTFIASEDENKRSELILSFDQSKNREDSWALASKDGIKSIEINLDDKHQANWEAKKYEQGQTTIWKIYPSLASSKANNHEDQVIKLISRTNTQGNSNPSQQNISDLEITINKIITQHAIGHTTLYLHYKNIPGYWDGQFALTIEKKPLMFKGDKVGIGTANPTQKLEVNGTVTATKLDTSNLKDIVYVNNDKVGIGTTVPNAKLEVNQKNNESIAIFKSNNGNHLNLKSNGRLDFNYTSADSGHALRIRSATTGKCPTMVIDNTAGTSNSLAWFKGKDSWGNTKSVYITKEGGIQLDGDLTIGGNITIGSNITIGGNITVGGRIYKNNLRLDDDKLATREVAELKGNDDFDGNWTHAIWKKSDQRLKTHITPLAPSLDKLTQLQSVSYQWNETALARMTEGVEDSIRAEKEEDNQKLWDEKKAEIREKNAGTYKGLIAQELEKVFPEWVNEDKDGYKTINVSELPFVLIEAIKELKQQHQEKIEVLEERVKRLESGE